MWGGPKARSCPRLSVLRLAAQQGSSMSRPPASTAGADTVQHSPHAPYATASTPARSSATSSPARSDTASIGGSASATWRSTHSSPGHHRARAAIYPLVVSAAWRRARRRSPERRRASFVPSLYIRPRRRVAVTGGHLALAGRCVKRPERPWLIPWNRGRPGRCPGGGRSGVVCGRHLGEHVGPSVSNRSCSTPASPTWCRSSWSAFRRLWIPSGSSS